MSQTNISVNSTLGPTIEVLSDGGIVINVANPVSGTGDVTSSSLSVDNQIVRFDGTSGKIIQNSGITIADGATGTLSGTNTGDQNLFGTFAVAGQSNVVADSTSDTLTLVAGSNITITTNASTDSITINSTASGSGDVVGPASATDNAIARYDQTTGKLIQNSGITIADGASGTLSGTNSGDQNLFGTIAVAGQSNIVADSTSDTLTLVAGTNITITTNDATDSITINSTASGSGDVVGPASATDNALVRYDGTTGKLIQNGQVTQSDTGDLAAINSMTMDTTPTGSLAAQGQMMWNADEETLDIQLNGFALHVGEHIVYHVKNSTGSTIAKGVPVMFAGTTGNSGKLLIQPWNGTGPATLFMGLTGESLTTGSEGFVIAFGKLRGIQTNGANYGQTWVDGEIIYAGTTTGSLTKTQPSAPNPIVQVLAVVYAHASNGTYFIRPNYILGDVFGPASSTDNALVRFDSTTGKLIQVSGITVADGASGTLAGSNSGDVSLAGTPDYITISGQTITRGLIDLAADVTGDLPLANLTQSSAASKLLGRGSASGAGDFEEITIGSGLTMSGTTISASGGGGSPGGVNTELQFNNSGAFGGADIRWVDPYLEMPLPGSVIARAKIGMQSGNDNGAFTASAGSLLTYGGNAGATPQSPGGGSGGIGGEIRTHGGNGFTSGEPGGDYSGGIGGYIHTHGSDATDGLNGAPGGYISTTNGGGNIDTSSNGGSINTNGSGGSINTSSGGGSINTSGTGSIGFGGPSTRTTLNGTATSNQTISLPDASGTLLLQNGALGTPSSGTLTNCTGLPIAGGGTGQTTAVAAFDALAPTTTKGDLIAHNGTDNIRLPVGATNGHVLTVDSAEASGIKWAAASSGKLAQAVTASSVTSGSTTANIPFDDTIPQNTEGLEILTLAITPTNASSTLQITATVTVSGGGLVSVAGALFVDSTANAIAANLNTVGGNGYFSFLTVVASISAGSTSARTYKFRIGNSTGGTVYYNRWATGDLYSTAGPETRITILEILP